MARRGTPLPWALREEIRKRRALGEPVRDVAKAVGVNKETVSRYAPTSSVQKRD